MRVQVHWRFLGYTQGLVIEIDLFESERWNRLLKLDALQNQPHFHIYNEFDRQVALVAAEFDDPRSWCLDQIRNLAELIRRSGRNGQAVKKFDDEFIRILVPAVTEAINQVIEA